MMDSNNTTSELVICGHNSQYLGVQVVVRTYFTIPVIIFGLIANMVNLVIFGHLKMRIQLVNWFLFSLSVTDSILLLDTFIMLCIPVLAENSGSLSLLHFSAFSTRWCYPFALTVQTFGVYLTVCVAVHRYLGVCHPFKMRRWDTPILVKTVVALALGLSIIFNLTRWVEVTLKECHSDRFNATSVLLSPTLLFFNQWYDIGYKVLAYTSVMFALPFTVLITVNVMIVKTVKRSTVTREEMLTMTERKASLGTVMRKRINDRKEQSTTVMLVAVVAMFLVFNSLAFINNILEILLSFRLIPASFMPVFTSLVEIGNLLVTLNSAATILIYYKFGTKYRSVFWLILNKRRGLSSEGMLHKSTYQRQPRLPECTTNVITSFVDLDSVSRRLSTGNIKRTTYASLTVNGDVDRYRASSCKAPTKLLPLSYDPRNDFLSPVLV